MKILVCVSKTPDTTTKIALNGDGTELDANGVQYIMNPYDEWYALVRGLELQETFGGTVTLMNVGPESNDAILRKGLAIGAHDAIRIDATPRSALYTAKQIAAYARQEQFDLVLLGKETIDYNGSEVGAMVAELLDMPFISHASKLELSGEKTAVVHRDIEGGTEELELGLPFVLSAAKGIAEQRIPNMRGIMMAKTKPLKVIAPTSAEDPAKVVKYDLPKSKSAVRMVSADDMEELVRLLHEEAKAL